MTYDEDSISMKLFVWQNRGEKCPTCTTKMLPVRNGARWCSVCGTLGELFIQSGSYEYIRFFTADVMKDKNQEDG